MMKPKARQRVNFTAADLRRIERTVAELDGKYPSQAETLLHAVLIAENVDHTTQQLLGRIIAALRGEKN
jgi:hypothetical protein